MPSNVSLPVPAGYLFLPVIYILFIVTVIVVAAVALWRLMKAQEETARALHRIASTFDRNSR